VSPNDGSLFVLTNSVATGCSQPSPAGIIDHYIWYLPAKGGSINVAGCASTLSTDQAGDLIAVRSNGGIYYTVPSALQPPPAKVTWNAIGGAAQSVAIGQNYHVYAISNVIDPQSQSYGIWECQTPFQGAQNPCPANSGAGGPWHQLTGALKGLGTSTLVSHFDVNSHTGLTKGVTCTSAPCEVNQDGFWLVRSDGSLFFYNPSYTPNSGWVKFTGISVKSVAPLSAAIGGACPCGVFAASGSPATALQYFDFSSPTAGWTPVSLPTNVSSTTEIAINSASANQGATLPGVGLPLYLVAATTNTVFTGLAQSIPMTVTIARGALNGAGAPNMGPPNNVYIYVYGKNQGGSFVYLTSSGSTAAWTSASTPAPLPWNSSSNPTPCPTAPGSPPCTSQTFALPPLSSGEIYLASSPIIWSGPGSAPAAWNPSDKNNSTYYDFVEYTWASAAAPVYVDTSQVNAMGLSLAFNLVGLQYPNGQQAGFQSGAVTALQTALKASTGWSFLATTDADTSGNPIHVLSPVGLTYPGVVPTAAPTTPAGAPTACTASPAPSAGSAAPNPLFANGAFLDCAFEAVWLNFLPPNYVVLAAAENMSGSDLYGQVDNNENLQFYLASNFANGAPVPSATPYVTLANPFHHAYGNTASATASLLQQNGFALGTYAYPPPPAPQVTTFPGNGVNPTPAAAVANMVSTAVNRGLLTSSTKSGTTIGCPPTGQFPAPLPTWPTVINVYAADLWQVALTYGVPATAGGGAPNPSTYNIPFADQCNQSTTRVENSPQSLQITVNGS